MVSLELNDHIIDHTNIFKDKDLESFESDIAEWLDCHRGDIIYE